MIPVLCSYCISIGKQVGAGSGQMESHLVSISRTKLENSRT